MKAMKTIGLVALLVATAIAAMTPLALEAQRDPGVNQPGAAGNRGAAGYGGSARQARVAHDPGVNQPGAAGNRRR